MPWREWFTNDDIAAALARCGFVAREFDSNDECVGVPWEFDWELTGDIELLSPGNLLTFDQIQTIVDEFKPDHVLIEAINAAMPVNGATRIRINLIWNKEP